ncbi:hypothetical protein RhiirA5_421732 [Rhizophagus irregularis]|uniref:Ubiquitin-like domain-containing protein n=2 Tax=Rhizophagus irregularis TaxID=588596 RepID=A0A2I1GP65_9GLOM|nr:hypothetical protein GLOIN_2v1547732 [Rhizophagus irregularis DAOM 181602=DAOM 197198]PKC04814.1 hypothetical protein RhiirA5_421732 [Rhizophagus irregularis]PKY48438.1 hypothetical protein RhiirA4_404407 [Rhizophagus irregularis]POG77534.1 hypothetical protein GLOIN_2v1547732 [Rhizophagus irregularis DAOM 181602=DAOM 197198]UZO26165.1 hypothetical protein OCT59_018411 [Rhizophagus irregularis]CAG8685872.1 11338_t:CDS:2 [Rhizophagus irregularis]|eukprot:XP_025184400.1 hypothetical protein GLOIN_2v1547732 [Rhizophagus irregularis DAOM 181602=DAOM 197198]
MKCTNCQIDKLSKEFPADIIGRKCSHIPSFCLKCLINYFDVQKADQTPQKCPECEVIISKQEVKDLNLAWEKALFRINLTKNKNNLNQNGEINTAKGNIYVILLNGTKLNFKLEDLNTVADLKEAIEKQTKVRFNKQKLSYKGVELQTFSDEGTKNKLSEYSIVPESHIQLMVLLYSISKELSINALTFDLFWGYPSTGRDFLDGTCMLYAGNQLYRTFDWSKKNFNDVPNVSHSGDIMDHVNKRGHHCITANLALMPSEITRLYFILSAYNSPNIGCFPNPSFKMYDPSDPDVQLCSYTIQSAADSQAVIMCVVERNEKDEKGNWNIFEIGRLSDGNAKYYQPIMETISNINEF